MIVTQLRNIWASWNPFTTVIFKTVDGDEIGVCQNNEDVLHLFGDNKEYAFGSDDAKDTVTIAIEV